MQTFLHNIHINVNVYKRAYIIHTHTHTHTSNASCKWEAQASGRCAKQWLTLEPTNCSGLKLLNLWNQTQYCRTQLATYIFLHCIR